ncbi:spondin domain-containing protein [Shewanella pneumatophori]|uniref:Spondin domain-containing protein n=1 Tax=Shewanella pneumatophori TaxID=314092 RepID=A0A9X2CJU1_9GAMM|nr:spondin domain-containing protein [Shewanella pneumatophori]MCL1141035.1 spondin domain-containing protein [Shewanella pneumatophori]
MNISKLSFKTSSLAALSVGALLLGGCSDNDHTSPAPITPPAVTPTMQDYTISVTNLTANQPMSPIAVVTHAADSLLWTSGESASLALETLAESGDASGLTDETGITELVSGAGILMPGASEEISLSLDSTSIADLSVVTMLVNTNDAFAGFTGYDLSSLAVDESMVFRVITYDAGTEANSEAKGTIPGPADGGEGFNATRDDSNKVHAHPGVISSDDGLSDSILDASHRFDNPTLLIKISRTE